MPGLICFDNQDDGYLEIMDVYLNEYPKKFIVDPQYIGLFMMLNGKPVTLLFNRSPK